MTDEPATAHGTHDHADDPRNAAVLVNVDGRLVPRAQAVVSVFDAGFVLGDGVWEGLRVSGGHLAFLEQHLDRLWEGAAALALDIGRSREELTAEIYRTLAANGMTDGVHVRLMVTRGPKSTPYQDPRMSAGPATLVIIAEHKDPLPATVERGLSLFTERSFSLTEVYSADEAFVTGTSAGLVPVHTVDGRRIGDGRRGPTVERLQGLYRDLVREDVAAR